MSLLFCNDTFESRATHPQLPKKSRAKSREIFSFVGYTKFQRDSNETQKSRDAPTVAQKTKVEMYCFKKFGNDISFVEDNLQVKNTRFTYN